MTPVIFLSSKTKTVMCLTEPMPIEPEHRSQAYCETLCEGSGPACNCEKRIEYLCTLKSAMETAVPVDLDKTDVFVVDAYGTNNGHVWILDKGGPHREYMELDKLYPLEGYGVEFKVGSSMESNGICTDDLTTKAFITKLSDSKHESQEELWTDFWKQLRMAYEKHGWRDMTKSTLELESKFTLTRKSTDTL